MTRYAEIIERLEAATGPDRELDVEVAKYAGASVRWKTGADGTTYQICWPTNELGRVADELPPLPEFSASLDAAVALVERLLPGAEYELTNLYGIARASVPLNLSDGPYYGTHEGNPASLAIALLLALFRALQAQEESR